MLLGRQPDSLRGEERPSVVKGLSPQDEVPGGLRTGYFFLDFRLIGHHQIRRLCAVPLAWLH